MPRPGTCQNVFLGTRFEFSGGSSSRSFHILGFILQPKRRGEDFRLQVSIPPTSTLEPTICVPDGMLVLWPSGAGDWDRDWEQRESALPQSPPARLFPCSFSAIFLAIFAICATANGARLPAQTQIPPHLSPFASTMTQQLLQGFSASPRLHSIPPSLPPSPPPPPLTSVLHHTHQTKRFFSHSARFRNPAKILRHASEAPVHSG